MIDVYNMTGEELKRYRRAAEKTQVQLARDLGVSERKLRHEESRACVSLIVARAMRDFMAARIMKETRDKAYQYIDFLHGAYGD